MISTLLVAGLWLAQGAATAEPRPLAADGAIRDSLAGGEKALFAFDVPAQMAARVSVKEEGVDVNLTLRRRGSSLPEHGLNFTAGPEGEELAYPAVSDTATGWTILIEATLPKAARGFYTITLETSPADDRARAVAAARQRHHDASETAWRGDGKAFREAAAGYAAASAAALEAGDLIQAAESAYQCARAYDSLGDLPAAVEWQQRALSLFRELGRRDRQGRALNRLGDLWRKTGDVADAEQAFREALPLARATGDAINVADVLNNSGLLMLSLGRWEESIEQFEGAVPLAEELESANVLGALTHNIGVAYANLGVYDKAIAAYERSNVVKRSLKLPRRIARTLLAMSAVYVATGDQAKAEATLGQALQLFREADDKAGIGETLAAQARVLHTAGETVRALVGFEQALPLLQQTRSRGAEMLLLTEWAKVEVDLGAVERALPRAQEALRISRLIASPNGEASALYVKALALERQERLDEAIQTIAAAVERVESMRGAIVSSELRTSYLTTVRGYFDLYIELLERKGSHAAAFAVSERARARALLEGLAESAAKIQKGGEPALLARRRSLQAALNAKEAYRAQLAGGGGERGARALAVDREIERLLEGWKDVQAKVRASSPAWAALQMPEPVSAERVQAALLDEGSALVSYHLGRSRGYVWVIDRRAVTVHELPAAAKLNDVARRYHELLGRDVDPLGAGERERLASEITAHGSRLAALVWKPIEARVRGKRLLIVADGALQYVPFAALPGPAGEPLLAAHDIAYLPSASVLDTLRRGHGRRIAGDATAVFADPVFTRDDPRVARAGGAPPAAAPAGSAARGAGGRTFEALDFSAAKKTLLERDLSRYRILHFATHGVLNTAHPELSGLVLSLVDPAGRPVDGFLRLHEIYNLDLDADLVVLSACRTALGKEVHGEGLIGLTRGFLYAGASRIVSSVWNVDDRASALLMSRFYAAMLSRGLAPSTALREAQLSLLREPRWANPHYWAAFGLQGDWR